MRSLGFRSVAESFPGKCKALSTHLLFQKKKNPKTMLIKQNLDGNIANLWMRTSTFPESTALN